LRFISRIVCRLNPQKSTKTSYLIGTNSPPQNVETVECRQRGFCFSGRVQFLAFFIYQEEGNVLLLAFVNNVHLVVVQADSVNSIFSCEYFWVELFNKKITLVRRIRHLRVAANVDYLLDWHFLKWLNVNISQTFNSFLFTRANQADMNAQSTEFIAFFCVAFYTFELITQKSKPK
jgi:hypothetical protein